MSRAVVRRVVVLSVPALAVLLAASGRPAPQASAPEERPGETPTLPPVRTELVQLDVLVTDREGRCVGGITPAEFEVLEDGRRQQVSQFAEEARPGLRTGMAAPPPPGTVPAQPRTPASARGRFFVLTVDDLHTAPGSMAEARKAMTRFVDEQVSAEDFVALATTSGAKGVFQDFTREKEASTGPSPVSRADTSRWSRVAPRTSASTRPS
jgi:hypothetical protein